MKRTIHTTKEDIRTQNSDATVSAISENGKKIEDITRAVKDKTVETLGFTGVVNSLKTNTNAIDDLHESINDPIKVVRKLDEIKSASLITNQELKKVSKNIQESNRIAGETKKDVQKIEIINEKPEKEVQKIEIVNEKPQKEVQKIEIVNEDIKLAGAFFSLLKGTKGDSGKDAKPPTQEELKKIVTPLVSKIRDEEIVKLIKPLIPDAKDGSPDSPEEIVDKVNSAKNKISWKKIKDVPDFSFRDTMNQTGYASGGANQVRYLNDGVVISDHVTEINYSTNITPTYDGNGRITLTASGSGGGTTTSYIIEPTSGAIDDSNTDFVFATQPAIIFSRSIAFREGYGFTWNSGTSTASLTLPPPTNSDVYGISTSSAIVLPTSGTVGANNKDFTFATLPVAIVSDGVLSRNGAGFTWNAGTSTATLTVAPTGDIYALSAGSSGSGGAVDSVNGQTGVVVLDADDISDTSTTKKFTSAGDISKLAGIEVGADVTDTANVTSAGALMDSEVDADIKTLSLPANTTISTFGASLIDDVDSATARTTIGLGNVDNTSDATKNSATATFTNKRITKRVVTVSDATSITPNSDNADVIYQNNTQATGTLTINADTGTPTNCQSLLIKMRSTNVQTFSWNAQYVGGTAPLPTATTGSSQIDYFSFIYDTVDSKWHFTGNAVNF